MLPNKENEKKVVLFDGFGLKTLMLCVFNRDKKETIFFDIYSRNITVFVAVLIKLIGRQKTINFIKTVGLKFGLEIHDVKHGDSVPDYHKHQLSAESLTKSFVEDFINSEIVDSKFVCGAFLGDKNASCSYIAQDLGVRLLPLVENLVILTATTQSPITVSISHQIFPPIIIELITRNFGVTIESSPAKFNLFPFFISLFCFFGSWITCAPYLFTPNLLRKKIRFDQILLAEFVDPDFCSGHITEPNYFSVTGITNLKTVAYVRRQNRSLFRGAKNRQFPKIACTLFLGKTGLCFSEFKLLLALSFTQIISISYGRAPVSMIKKYVNDVSLAVDLCSLFRQVNAKAHVYSVLPNGRTTTRFDSGIVTGACRKFGVKSISYQTRVYYHANVYYFFQCFDIFYFWGSAWKELYATPQMIKKCEVGGNAAYALGNSKGSKKNVVSASNIVVFGADLDRHRPLHYTLSYGLSFFESVLKAVELSNNKYLGKKLNVIIKTKDPEHIRLIKTDPKIAELILKLNSCVEFSESKRHEYKKLLEVADIVVSSGFTSPGFDAICMGVPSAYFTPFSGIYNELFDELSEEFVFNSVDGLARFFASPRIPDLDKYRSLNGMNSDFFDGKSLSNLLS